MKVELRDAKVELEVGEGKSSLYINGHNFPIPREVGVSLIFGDDVVTKPTSPPSKPGLAKAPSSKQRSFGCQSPASKRKLSASLKKFHANKRRKEKAALRAPIKKHLNGKSHLNGASIHVN